MILAGAQQCEKRTQRERKEREREESDWNYLPMSDVKYTF
jgi:hypothetical protein